MAVNKPTLSDYLERKELGLRVLRLLQDAVFAAYTVGNPQTIPYFNESGDENFVPHHLNKRQSEANGDRDRDEAGANKKVASLKFPG